MNLLQAPTPTAVAALGSVQTQAPGQSYPEWGVLVLPVLQLVVPSLLAAFFAWLVMRHKSKLDADLEEIKASLKRIGDADHVRFQALYQRRLDAVTELLTKQQAIFHCLNHLEVVTDRESLAQRLGQAQMNLLQRDTAKKLGAAIDSHFEAFVEKEVWLDDDGRSAARRLMEAALELGAALVLVSDASDNDLQPALAKAVEVSRNVADEVMLAGPVLRRTLEPELN